MEKGYDAGKKVSGIKRHIAVDTQGLPHALAVTTADVTDRKGCLLALKRDLDNLGAVQKFLADGGYTGQAFASSVQALIGAEVEGERQLLLQGVGCRGIGEGGGKSLAVEGDVHGVAKSDVDTEGGGG